MTPYNVRIEGSYTKGSRYLRDADQLMMSLRSMLEASGIDNGGLHANFAPDVYAYARVGSGVAVVNIVADPDEEAPEEIVPERFFVVGSPDFLSGVVYQGFIVNTDDAEVLDDFRPDQRTVQLFDMDEGRQNIARLAVKPFPVLAEELSGQGPLVNSQYRILRPGFYSGTMKKLVQTLMGYGKFDEKSIYGSTLRLASDDFFFESRFQGEVKRAGTQIRYDWRFHRTQGLTRAEDGRWWLVEIRQGRGVYAMPLPVYEVTTTAEFRAKAEAVGDEAAIAVLDLFGGFPTGESLPGTAVELGAMERAGYVVQGLDAAAIQSFYSYLPYSPWHGWAFSESGSKADNTGWKVDPDFYQTGVHFRCEFSIGELDDSISPQLRPSRGGSVTLKRHVLSAGVAGPGRVPPPDFRLRIRAVLLKIDRLTFSQVELFLLALPVTAFEQIDALVMPPIAEFNAAIWQVSSSRIFQPYRYGPQYKFYDPNLGGIVSHDGRASFGAMFNDRPTRTNATVHVFYIGEMLHYVRLFCRIRPDSVIDTIEDNLLCGLVGELVSTKRFDIDDDANGVYTETYDDRATSFSSETVIRAVGTRVGPSSVRFTDIPFAPFTSSVVRTWRFRIETTTRITNSGNLTLSSVAAPYGMRESYFYAVRKYKPGSSVLNSVGFEHRNDAYSYTAWRNFPGFTGFLPASCANSPQFPACWTLGQHPAGCGPVTERLIWQQNPPDEDNECTALVNAGPWTSPCANVLGLLFDIPTPVIPQVGASTPDQSELEVFFVSSNQTSPARTFRNVETGQNAVFNGNKWFLLAPDDSGGPQFIDANQNEMGYGSLLSCSKTINETERHLTGTPRHEDMLTELFTFVGVING